MSSNSPPQTPAPPNRRRSSIAELFGSRSSTGPNANANGQSFSASVANGQPRPHPNNPPRRMSITTALGVSGSPNGQNSPFSNISRRRDSVSSSQDSGSPTNEAAIMEDDEGVNPQNTPVSPFARRVSFGAQAFGSVRSGGGGSFSNGNSGRPSLKPLAEKPSNISVTTRPRSNTATAGKSRGEGFNWESNLREKSSRPPPAPAPHVSAQSPQSQFHRSATVATMEPPKHIPVPQQTYKPDPLGERMLRGDFMMD